MISPQRKRELLQQAKTYAEGLRGADVSRAELRHVLNTLYLAASPSSGAASRLIEALPTSWVAERSRRTRGQLEAVRTFFREVQAKKLPAEELRFLLGWTVRTVHVKDLKDKESEAARRATKPANGG